jgi:type I restriction enzyme R subunit
MFDTENLTDSDMLNYSQTIWDKIKENDIVMQQIANNPADKIMLGDYPDATLDAIFDSQEAYQEITKQLLSDSNRLAQFTRFLLDNKLSA